MLARFYLEGGGQPKDIDLGLSWLRKAAAQEYDEACFLLGRMYEEGQDMSQNSRQAAEWLRKAARKGHVEAMRRLGLLCLEGRGLPQDDREASKWLYSAAEEGDQEAARLLERMRAEGRQIWRLQDDLETMEERLEIDTLHEMAARGLAEAQRDLGIRYLQGRGLPRDVRKGRDLLRQAADQGDAEAKKLLRGLKTEVRQGQSVPAALR